MLQDKVQRAVVVFGMMLAHGPSGTAAAGVGASPSRVASSLRTSFGEAAEEALRGREAPRREGDALVLGEDALSLHVPRASGALELRGEGWTLAVEELGRRGEAALVEGAISYARVNGRSFWTATGAGVEQWFTVGAGLARRGVVVARWRVRGGRVESGLDGQVRVHVEGGPTLRVTAPRAFTASGRGVPVTLAARGDVVTVSVDADGEAVLVDPEWSLTGSLVVPRSSFATTVLSDGRVFVTGGFTGEILASTASAEVYDPIAGTWTRVSDMSTPLVDHSATALADDRVLVVSTHGAEIYDPATDAWSPAAPPLSLHTRHVAARLGDGKVLVVGGQLSGDAELYDPVLDTWTAAGNLGARLEYPGIATLHDGRVLVFGGRGLVGPRDDAHVYDPASGSWTAVAPMTAARTAPGQAVLPDGRVFVSGGNGFPSTEIYDPVTNTWAVVGGSFPSSRNHTVNILGPGWVLVAGGITTSQTAHVFDSVTGLWHRTPFTPARSGHGGVTLDDGSVLIFGGHGSTPLASARILSPRENLALGEGCVAAGECASGFCARGPFDYGRCCDVACTGQCERCDTGACLPVADGGFCSDGLSCTGDDRCAHGACVPGAPRCDPMTTCAELVGRHECGSCPAGTASTDGTGSTECVPCADGTFAAAPGARECAPWTPCAAGQYEVDAPSAMNDRACADCTLCASPELEVSPCTATHDTVCAGLSDAGLPDAGLLDAGVSDAGLLDAGLSDAGGLPDASSPSDAGRDDAGLTRGDGGHSSTDGGLAPKDASAAFDSGALDAGPGPSPTGCGCRISAPASSHAGALWLVLGLVVLRRRCRSDSGT